MADPPKEVRFERLYVGRGRDSELARGVRPQVFIAWMMVSPSGHFTRWPDSRLRRWWLRRRGHVFYDGDGQRVG